MKYKVIYRSTTYYEAEIEANSFDGAKEIADEMDGGEFTEDVTTGSWELDMIVDEEGRTEEY